MFIIFF